MPARPPGPYNCPLRKLPTLGFRTVRQPDILLSSPNKTSERTVRTRKSVENPYGHDRYAFAWEHVPCDTAAHLDFGCAEGDFLDSLRPKGIRRLVGVDASRAAIESGRRRFPSLELVHLTQTVPLPFEDQSFSCISVLDVIEHVDKQTEVLDEINRVARDDALLIVTVPRQYILSFLDMGNFKFRFPRLHRWFYCLRHSQQEYDRHYVTNPDGLIGDISAQKAWHEHFSPQKLEALLRKSGFVPVNFDGSGFFMRGLVLAEPFVRWFSPMRPVITQLKRRDNQYFASMNLFCVARKQSCPGDSK